MSVQPIDEAFAGHAGPWTENDWLALPESMGRVELLDGSLLVSPHPAGPHQRIVRNLAGVLEAAALDEFEIFEGLHVRVAPGSVLIPDIAVLNTPGLDHTIFDAELADLVVEVTSPSNSWNDRVTKLYAYARAGIPNYLRVDLDQGVERVSATAYALTSDGVYADVTRLDLNGRPLLDHPFPVALALTELATATRRPGHPTT